MDRPKKFALFAGLAALLTGGVAVKKTYDSRVVQQTEFDPNAKVVKADKKIGDGGEIKVPDLPDLGGEEKPDLVNTPEDLQQANDADQADAAEKIDALRDQISAMEGSVRFDGQKTPLDDDAPLKIRSNPSSIKTPLDDEDVDIKLPAKGSPVQAEPKQPNVAKPTSALAGYMPNPNTDWSAAAKKLEKIDPTTAKKPAPSVENEGRVEISGPLKSIEQVALNTYLQTVESLGRETIVTSTTDRTSLNLGKKFYVVNSLSDGGFRITTQDGKKFVDLNNRFDGLTLDLFKQLNRK